MTVAPHPMIVTVSSVALDIYEPPSTDVSISGPIPEGSDWSRYLPTPPADACIVRFGQAEADVAHGDLIGLGRHSAARFPRLGGLLHGRVAAGSEEESLLIAGATQTVRAGYQVVLATGEVADEAIVHHDTESLWTAFVPMSYRVPQPIAQLAWDVCHFEDYWVTLLCEIGLAGAASRFADGQTSPLSRSIRGLSTVGVALALAERGAPRERPRRPRRTLGGRRISRWELPPVPRRSA